MSLHREPIAMALFIAASSCNALIGLEVGERRSAKNECETSDPNRVFCSGFEEGDKHIWDDSDGNPDANNLLMADPGPFGIEGNHVMRMSKGDLVKVLPSGQARLYARFYLRYEPGFDLTSGHAGAALHGGEKITLGGDVRPKGDDYF